MKILCTGGAGFISSHLIDALLARGHTVISVDDYSAGKAQNLDNAREHGAHFIEWRMDVADLTVDHLAGVEVIFHLAASKKTVCLKNPMRDLAVNGGGTLHLLQIAERAGVRRFIHASTGSVYGEHDGMIHEQSPFNPVSFYGISKLAGERYVNLFHETFHLPTTILRFFHVYGPRQEWADDKGGVVAIFIRRMLAGLPLTIYGTGFQTRSFTYVGDVVRACLFALDDERTIGNVYNIASGIKVNLDDLVKNLTEISGITPKVNYQDWQTGDIREFDVLNFEIRRLGFNFETEFKNGLRRTWDWYNAMKYEVEW